MEYVVGPIIALLLGMKFTDYKSKELIKAAKEDRAALVADVQEQIVVNNKMISQQTLKMMMPMASSVQKINSQIGL